MRAFEEMRIVGVGLVLGLCSGCGGGDEKGDDANSGGQGGTAGSAGSSGASGTSGSSSGSGGSGGSGGSSGNGSGEFLEATGTINGAAFSVSCDLKDPVTSSFTSGSYKGHAQCTAAIEGHQAFCRADETGLGGLMGQLTVGVGVFGSGDKAVSLADSLAGQINQTSPNVVTNEVTVDSLEILTSVSGSFSGEWEDDGSGMYGDVTGSFSFTCPPP